jgi:hypothetical protein
MKFLNHKLDNLDLFKIVLVIAFFLTVILNVAGIFKLITGSYNINKSDLYQLDTLELQSQAYEYAGKSGTRIEFEDTSGFHFEIGTFSVNSILDYKHLSDTFRYDGVNFIPFTDKDGLATYKQKLKRKTIAVYQIQIGEKQFIDLDKTNHLIKKALLVRTVLFAAVYVIGFIIYKVRRRKLQRTT